MDRHPVERKRLALVAVALVGAASVALPWARSGLAAAPLTVDTAGTAIVGGGFLVAAGLALAGERSAPLRSSTPLAVAVSLVGGVLLAFAARAWALTSKTAEVEPGLGVYVAAACSAVLAVGAWLRSVERPGNPRE